MTIAEAWQDYERQVLPADAVPEQRSQLKMAFYAGAAVIMEINQRIGEPDISEDGGVRILHAIDEELRQFVVDIQHRKRRR
jgi:hypothetical protein